MFVSEHVAAVFCHRVFIGVMLGDMVCHGFHDRHSGIGCAACDRKTRCGILLSGSLGVRHILGCDVSTAPTK